MIHPYCGTPSFLQGAEWGGDGGRAWSQLRSDVTIEKRRTLVHFRL